MLTVIHYNTLNDTEARLLHMKYNMQGNCHSQRRTSFFQCASCDMKAQKRLNSLIK